MSSNELTVVRDLARDYMAICAVLRKKSLKRVDLTILA